MLGIVGHGPIVHIIWGRQVAYPLAPVLAKLLLLLLQMQDLVMALPVPPDVLSAVMMLTVMEVLFLIVIAPVIAIVLMVWQRVGVGEWVLVHSLLLVRRYIVNYLALGPQPVPFGQYY